MCLGEILDFSPISILVLINKLCQGIWFIFKTLRCFFVKIVIKKPQRIDLFKVSLWRQEEIFFSLILKIPTLGWASLTKISFIFN
jgi:hypothetical protein